MRSRRNLLTVGLAMMAAGCAGTPFTDDEDSATASPTDMGSQPPPWDREDSSMDLAVDNWMDNTIQAQIEFEGYTKEFELESGLAWFSEDVIESGASPEVTLSLEGGRNKSVKWEPENDNEQYLKFDVHPEEITYRMAEKGTEFGTSSTESDPGDI